MNTLYKRLAMYGKWPPEWDGSMGRRKDTPIFVPSRRPRGCGCLFWLLILAVVIVAGIVVLNDIGNRQVKLVKQPVSVLGLSRDLEGFSILHISDLHAAELGKEQSYIATAIQKASYKAVCITGDMVGESGNVQPFLTLLSLLKKDVPILFIPGDCDPAPLYTSAHDTLSVLAPYITAAQAAGAIYLDAPYPLTVGKTTVWFSPEGLYSMNTDTTIAYCQDQLTRLNGINAAANADGAAEIRAWEYRLDCAKRLQDARQKMKSTDYHIALSHAPLTYDYVRSVWDWQDDQGTSMQRVTLALAGHLNGGQWRIPGNGPIYVPGLSWFPEDRLVTGLSRVSTIAQYISPGLGSSCYYPLQPGRLFNPPAITLLNLTGKPQ